MYFSFQLDIIAKRMDSAGRCIIQLFEITCKKYGTIKYLNGIDVAGLNFDVMCLFRKREISLHPDNENDKTEKLLNQQATVMLKHIWQGESTLLEYENQLKTLCQRQNAKFIQYDPDRRQLHFKIYGLGTYNFDNSTMHTKHDKFLRKFKLQKLKFLNKLPRITFDHYMRLASPPQFTLVIQNILKMSLTPSTFLKTTKFDDKHKISNIVIGFNNEIPSFEIDDSLATFEKNDDNQHHLTKLQALADYIMKNIKKNDKCIMLRHDLRCLKDLCATLSETSSKNLNKLSLHPFMLSYSEKALRFLNYSALFSYFDEEEFEQLRDLLKEDMGKFPNLFNPDINENSEHEEQNELSATGHPKASIHYKMISLSVVRNTVSFFHFI